MTRPPKRAAPPPPAPAMVKLPEPPPVMNVFLANALITGAPLTTEELACMRTHFVELVRLLAMSGPRFVNARNDAVRLHNSVIARIKGEREALRRRALEDEPELMEIA